MATNAVHRFAPRRPAHLPSNSTRPVRHALVTGAAGFIGSNLVDELLRRGYRVTGIDSFDDYYNPALKRANLIDARRDLNFQLVQADLASLDLLPLIEDSDVVFHLAGQPGVRNSWGPEFVRYAQNNLVVTQRLLEALTHRPLPTVVASTSSVYGCGPGHPLAENAPMRPASPYGLTKAAVEQLVGVYRSDRGVPVTCLRYFTVFGPRQRPDMAFNRFIDALLEQRPLTIYGTGHQSRDFTFVGDVVAATIAAAGAPEPVYNVGGGAPATVCEAIAVLEEELGVEARLDRVARARGDVERTWGDTTLIREGLGWQPRTSLREGLRAQVEHVLDQRAGAGATTTAAAAAAVS